MFMRASCSTPSRSPHSTISPINIIGKLVHAQFARHDFAMEGDIIVGDRQDKTIIGALTVSEPKVIVNLEDLNIGTVKSRRVIYRCPMKLGLRACVFGLHSIFLQRFPRLPDCHRNDVPTATWARAMLQVTEL